MKKVTVEEAIGMELCHDITAMRDGFKGAAFKRGHIITKEDIPALLDIGKKTVYVWEDREGEIHEEDAALRLSAMAPADGAHYTGPAEGKMQLMADIRGMFRVDTKLLEEINSRGTTVVVVTHNKEIVNSMRKRVVRLRKGVIISDEKEGVYVED